MFRGPDEPAGLIITIRYVRDTINPFQMAYLKDAVHALTCSRSSMRNCAYFSPKP